MKQGLKTHATCGKNFRTWWLHSPRRKKINGNAKMIQVVNSVGKVVQMTCPVACIKRHAQRNIFPTCCLLYPIFNSLLLELHFHPLKRWLEARWNMVSKKFQNDFLNCFWVQIKCKRKIKLMRIEKLAQIIEMEQLCTSEPVFTTKFNTRSSVGVISTSNPI